MSPSKMVMHQDIESSYYKKHLEGVLKLKKKLWLVPLSASILLPLTFVIPYYFSVKNGQAQPIFPYISDSGSAGLPSSHIFTSMLDTHGILWFIFVWIRYKQVTYYLNEELPNRENIPGELRQPKMLDRLHRMNMWATLSLIGASIGNLIVANFRSSEDFFFHGIGVGFILTPLFIAYPCMIYLIRKLSQAELESPPRLLIFSMIIAWISMCCCAISILCAIPGDISTYADINFRLFYPEDHPKYWWHVSAAIFEWILMGTFSFISLSIALRMRKFKHWDQISI